MGYLKTLRNQATPVILGLFLLSIAVMAQQGVPTPPNLGTTASYGAFSGAGAIGNTGLTLLTGDIGTNAGAFTGFPPGQYTGAKHVADPQSLVAKNDLTIAWNQAGLIPCDTTLNVTLGNGQVLTPRTYCAGPASTLTGTMTFDAQGDPNAVFVVKIGGALNAAAGVHIVLVNGAQAYNIYWRVDGAVSILDNSIFKGTIIANGSIHLYGGTSLEGRALALVGAITLASNSVVVPVDAATLDSLIVVRPSAGDSIKGGTKNYQITWAGTGIASKKTFDYSLDSGATWTKIGDLDSNVFSYKWNVPDTVSKKAMVRITDKNNLSGKSGLFSITSSRVAGTLVVVTPMPGEVVDAKTKNYQITWSGVGIDATKTFEYSLDGGATWSTIGKITSDAFAYSWNVPDTASAMAMVRITDGNGAVGNSGIFIIRTGQPNTGTIVVMKPAADEVIAGGSRNYQITWSGTNIADMKTFEYSLDGGATWNLIGLLTSDGFTYSWTDVPNVATTHALIRITDANKVTGTSGMFTITRTDGIGSINSLILTGLDAKKNIGNNMPLGISWTFTPDIGSAVEVEYSLDYTATWSHIATVQTADEPNTTWMTIPAGYYNPVFIRITGSKGMTRTSEPFSIGVGVAGVATSAQNEGYALSNYPSPVSGRTTISYTLPVASDITLTISNGLGSDVMTILSQHSDAGVHMIPFDASKLSEGVYYYMLRTGSTTLVGTMIVVR